MHTKMQSFPTLMEYQHNHTGPPSSTSGPRNNRWRKQDSAPQSSSKSICSQGRISCASRQVRSSADSKRQGVHGNPSDSSENDSNNMGDVSESSANSWSHESSTLDVNAKSYEAYYNADDHSPCETKQRHRDADNRQRTLDTIPTEQCRNISRVAMSTVASSYKSKDKFDVLAQESCYSVSRAACVEDSLWKSGPVSYETANMPTEMSDRSHRHKLSGYDCLPESWTTTLTSVDNISNPTEAWAQTYSTRGYLASKSMGPKSIAAVSDGYLASKSMGSKSIAAISDGSGQVSYKGRYLQLNGDDHVEKGVGECIVWGFDEGGACISRFKPSSDRQIAAKLQEKILVHQLHVGDRLLSINGKIVVGLTQDQILEIWSVVQNDYLYLVLEICSED